MKQPARKPSWRIMALNEVALALGDLKRALKALWRNVFCWAARWFI